MPTDGELLAAWRTGDDAAGRELFARHFDGLYRFFANKVGRGIEDLVQETFLACVEHRGDIREVSSFRGFLYGVARRRLYRKWRDENRGAGAIDIGLTSVAELGPSPSAIAADAQEQKLILGALRRIPLEFQIALELFYWEDLRASELAAVLEIPEGTVRSRLRRGRQLLEKQINLLAKTGRHADDVTGDLEQWARSIRAVISPSGTDGS